jgi:hypothetical protein
MCEEALERTPPTPCPGGHMPIFTDIDENDGV